MGLPQFMWGKQLGAPALGTLGVGDLARVLDAALNAGFATQSATISVTGSVATVTVTGHDWLKGQTVTISGVTGGPTGFANLNQTQRITSIATNTFTMPAAGVSNGSATGTILAKLSALGVTSAANNPWGIAFTATNQRAYRAAVGLRHYLMINDNSNTNTCIVRAFATMSAVTTGVGPTPTATQSDTNLRWERPDPTAFANIANNGAGTYNDSWVIFGDDKRFFLGICTSNAGYRMWCGFGEFQSYKASDAFNTFIMGSANTDGTDVLNPASAPQSSPQQAQGTDAYYTSKLAAIRAANQSTLSVILGWMFPWGSMSSYPTESALLGTAPVAGTSSPISAGLELGFIEVLEIQTTSYYRRGRMPMLCAWNSPDFENNDGTIYTISGFGDVVLLRGWNYYPTYGLIFPMTDLDTVLA